MKNNVYNEWKHVCDNNEEILECVFKLKLINMRDRCMNGIF